jgi:hypothetical protein
LHTTPDVVRPFTRVVARRSGTQRRSGATMDVCGTFEFIDPSGAAFRAFRAPAEWTWHQDRNGIRHSVVFETGNGRWIGAVELDAEVDFDRLRPQDVLDLLERAVREG